MKNKYVKAIVNHFQKQVFRQKLVWKYSLVNGFFNLFASNRMKKLLGSFSASSLWYINKSLKEKNIDIEDPFSRINKIVDKYHLNEYLSDTLIHNITHNLTNNLLGAIKVFAACYAFIPLIRFGWRKYKIFIKQVGDLTKPSWFDSFGHRTVRVYKRVLANVRNICEYNKWDELPAWTEFDTEITKILIGLNVGIYIISGLLGIHPLITIFPALYLNGEFISRLQLNYQIRVKIHSFLAQNTHIVPESKPYSNWQEIYEYGASKESLRASGGCRWLFFLNPEELMYVKLINQHERLLIEEPNDDVTEKSCSVNIAKINELTGNYNEQSLADLAMKQDHKLRYSTKLAMIICSLTGLQIYNHGGAKKSNVYQELASIYIRINLWAQITNKTTIWAMVHGVWSWVVHRTQNTRIQDRLGDKLMKKIPGYSDVRVDYTIKGFISLIMVVLGAVMVWTVRSLRKIDVSRSINNYQLLWVFGASGSLWYLFRRRQKSDDMEYDNVLVA